MGELRPTPIFGVLDQSPIAAGRTPAEAVAETIELARVAERLGYRRYWLAEHHNSGGLAGSAPEVLIARIAAETKRIRIGSGGVMLSHYSPFKVAEVFRMLETLYPGRIDLGIGRAPGSDGMTARALQRVPEMPVPDDFPRQLTELEGFLAGTLPPSHPFARIEAMPTGSGMPEIWLLGSSDYSAAYAAHLGYAFSFAHFIAGGGGEAVVRAYRDAFRPSSRLAAPRASIGVSVVCAASEHEARRLAASRELWRLRLRGGDPGTIPTPEEALAYPYSAVERRMVEQTRRGSVAGDLEQVRAALLDLAARYDVDEIIIVTVVHDFRARIRSYELIAEAFGLGGPVG
ncbi:MAG: LLM class flavin-dependent oxidoreductase [Alphaproteobacteria bacterium]|nr:LLM class flavin-dependent oxidoreductase [Alphaproteobacteria bacterium]